MSRCGENVTVDLGSAIDGLLEGAMANGNLAEISRADSPAACVSAGGVVRRPGPFATAQERHRGFICAMPGPEMSSSEPRTVGLGNIFKNVAANPVPFFIGAISAPVLMGFVSRLLDRPNFVGARIHPLATRGVAFAGTIAGTIFYPHPILMGALVGQAVPTLDLFASWLVEKLVPQSFPASRPEFQPALASSSQMMQIPTEQDILELEGLKRALAGGQGSPPTVSGLGFEAGGAQGNGSARTISVRGAASESVPRKFC